MEPLSCLCPAHGRHALQRRGFLKLAGAAGIGWLTPLGQLLSRAAEQRGPTSEAAQSVIVLWMAGGPSQLETFDPHPGKAIAGDTKAIKTALADVQLAAGLERVADLMGDISLIRSMVSKEGDHERGAYTLKTGYRPDPTLIHPALGAIISHELPAGETQIPRHVSILPSQWPARGGFLGDEYDAFKLYDPANKLPDVTRTVSEQRDRQRLADLDVVEKAFARGRQTRVEATGHREVVDRARLMMSSEQLRAFDTSEEPKAVRELYGDTPFGRGCLAARRLIQVGVRCVEVTHDGWDTHANNHKLCEGLVGILDPAFSALLKDLKQRDLLRKTVVVCVGEFGRTPKINPTAGRDHWPEGFSVAIAGGGIRAGQVVGATDPEGSNKKIVRPVTVGELHATVLKAVGLDPKKVNIATLGGGGRPIHLAEGAPIRELVG
ncbi:hypothetical protein AYO44_01280 [Planctomycetaceae bacterium SCGC AG-212-F19]|nr:hypothetical protein AYO44_01280 [Planctomycetaceae bacterium SCGC AG-212-F19]